MCLKKQEFQADCVYKLGVYKKKVCTRFKHWGVVLLSVSLDKSLPNIKVLRGRENNHVSDE